MNENDCFVFPHILYYFDHGQQVIDEQHQGMSLRDYFAIHATEKDIDWAVAALEKIEDEAYEALSDDLKDQILASDRSEVSIVEARYFFADAMLAERSK